MFHSSQVVVLQQLTLDIWLHNRCTTVICLYFSGQSTPLYIAASIFFTSICTLVTNVAFFVCPFVRNKQFLAEFSGDSDGGFDEVYEIQSIFLLVWMYHLYCCLEILIVILTLLQANEGDESDDDDGMLCECPSCTFPPLALACSLLISILSQVVTEQDYLLIKSSTRLLA